MRSSLLHAMALAAAVTVSGPAGAWLIYPDRDDPDRMIVEIERPYGDRVPFGSLPPPFNRLVRGQAGPQSLLFRWPYEREAIGSAFLDVDQSGRGHIAFEFVARKLVDGQRLGRPPCWSPRTGRRCTLSMRVPIRLAGCSTTAPSSTA